MIALFFVAVCVLGAITAFNDYRYEVTTPALYLPQWIYTVWLPLLSALMVFRTCQSIVESFRERN
jgi:TRAP-type C4-dicarboxylate transport system permease small subunit